MKSFLTVLLKEGLLPVVKKGELIKEGAVLAKDGGRIHKEKILLSQLLQVEPAKISRYLTKKLGTQVNKGEVLAQKESFFKKIQVKSPLTGVLESVNLKEGTLMLSAQKPSLSQKSPIQAVVEKVSDEQIVLSFEGRIFKAEKSQGSVTVGLLTVIKKKMIDLFAFGGEVAEKIALGYLFAEEARVKLNVLGTKAIIAQDFYNDFPVAMKVATKVFQELVKFKNRKVVLQPENNCLVIPLA